MLKEKGDFREGFKECLNKRIYVYKKKGDD